LIDTGRKVRDPSTTRYPIRSLRLWLSSSGGRLEL
jgi:hypothetical protein